MPEASGQKPEACNINVIFSSGEYYINVTLTYH